MRVNVEDLELLANVAARFEKICIPERVRLASKNSRLILVGSNL